MKVQGPGPVHASTRRASAPPQAPDPGRKSDDALSSDPAPRDVSMLRRGSNALRLADRVAVMQTAAAPAARELERVGSAVNGLGAVLAPACLGASALGLSSSLQSLRNGQKVEGALGVASNTAGLVGSAAATAQALDIATSISASLSLGPVAAVGAAVAAGLEGVRDTHVGIRDRDAHRISSGGLKSIGGSIMTYGALHVHPVIVASGAAVFLGGVAYSLLRAGTSSKTEP